MLPTDLLFSLPTQNSTKEKAENPKKSSKSQSNHYNYTDLFKTPKLCQTTLIILYLCFSIVLPYFGLSVFSTSLAGNRYVNFFLSGLVEVLAILLSSYALHRWGRPKPIGVCSIVCGIFCFLSPFPKNALQHLGTAFALIAKVGAAAAFWSSFVHVAELYPTVVGNSGFSLCVLVSRTSTILMPFMRLLSDVWQPLPYVIMGSLTVLAGALVLLVPETKNRPVPATIEEFEKLHKKRRNAKEEGDNAVIAGKSDYKLCESGMNCDV
ncbi:organic cation transporter protein-like [Ptychodera flava]|uniref:organic cation transporter protein-like n=1 Tax=Ptychodera flava TaxID=63121 RepID=UPI003969C6C5